LSIKKFYLSPSSTITDSSLPLQFLKKIFNFSYNLSCKYWIKLDNPFTTLSEAMEGESEANPAAITLNSASISKALPIRTRTMSTEQPAKEDGKGEIETDSKNGEVEPKDNDTEVKKKKKKRSGGRKKV
jgi:hypothetical protein